MKTGIDRLALHLPPFHLDLRDLARARGVDPAKYLGGLGQEQMSVAGPDEDIVTLAAAAGARALAGEPVEALDAVIVATEGGVDQSKASAIYVHRLLGLPSTCAAFEIKQACCGSTAALQFALDRVARRPDRKVLVIGSDIARYDPGSPGEPTQGAGAAALLVSANPRLLAFDTPFGGHTEDVMDFWRPNYRATAVVDGHYSIRVYLHALDCAWQDYQRRGGPAFSAHHRFCYHLPFTRMAIKAHQRLAASAGQPDLPEAYATSLTYSRLSGNCYTGSLWMALASLLDHEPDLTERRVGFFSYGSGCMAAYFGGAVQPDYRRHLCTAEHRALFAQRRPLSVGEYEFLQAAHLPEDGGAYTTPPFSPGRFRFAGLAGHRRLYEDAAA